MSGDPGSERRVSDVEDGDNRRSGNVVSCGDTSGDGRCEVTDLRVRQSQRKRHGMSSRVLPSSQDSDPTVGRNSGLRL